MRLTRTFTGSLRGPAAENLPVLFICALNPKGAGPVFSRLENICLARGYLTKNGGLTSEAVIGLDPNIATRLGRS